MVEPNQIQMDYEAMEKAAQSFGTAADTYKKIIGHIHQCQETLQYCLIGSSGIAAQNSTDQLIQLLQQIQTRSERMGSQIRDAANTFRTGADPSAAQLFQGGQNSNNDTSKLKSITQTYNSDLTKAASTIIPGQEYGPVLKGKRPPGLPENARQASAKAAALPFVEQYSQKVAQERGLSNSFSTISKDLAIGESGGIFGRPADRFDNPRTTAWGVFQFNKGAWQTLPNMKDSMPWNATPQQEIELPIQKYADKFQTIKNIKNTTDLDAMRGVFLWQKAPKFLKQYQQLLKGGIDGPKAWQETLNAWKQESNNKSSWGKNGPHIPESIR